MRGPIILSGYEAADNDDVLQGTRLQTVAGNGFLTFELQSDSNNATDFVTVSVQLPGGDTPMNGTRVPAGSSAGVIDDRTDLTASFPVGQGGHTVFSVDVNGTAGLAWRITYTPMG